MDFGEVENLKQEDVMELYDDIMEFGDDTRVADCCCASAITDGGFYRAGCISWCRGQGSFCRGWDCYRCHSYYGDCSFGCQVGRSTFADCSYFAKENNKSIKKTF